MGDQEFVGPKFDLRPQTIHDFSGAALTLDEVCPPPVLDTGASREPRHVPDLYVK
jgi:hypothetical protein